MQMISRKMFLLALGFCLFVSQGVAKEHHVPQEYMKWLEELKQEMSDKGISDQTLKKAFAKNYYHPQHQVIRQDRNQNEFVLTTSAYLKKAISSNKIEKGRELYKKLLRKYSDGILGVPLHYLVAFWGMETNYGTYKGNHSTIEALTVLSYDKRRPKFFRKELYNALKILDENHIEFDQMKSSWAGAMGHFQFMPSTFIQYGKDADNDNKINIWENFDDAILSAANYLSDIGWKTDEPWGIPVKLDWNFNYAQTGRNKVKSVTNWKKAGVIVGSEIKNEWKGAIIVPEGYRGQAYLVLDNFHIIMKWNKSENYALAVGLLADEIKGHKKILTKEDSYRFTTKEIKDIQQFINDHKIDEIVVDGSLGSKTRQAIQKLQKKFKLPADGYPNYRLLKNMADFAKNNYYPPIPDKKLHRAKQVPLRNRKKRID